MDQERNAEAASQAEPAAKRARKSEGHSGAEQSDEQQQGSSGATAAAAAAAGPDAAAARPAVAELEQQAAELEQQAARLLDEARQKRELLHMARQASSSFVQLLLPSGVVPLVAAKLAKGKDKLQLALACKALLADYGRQPAAWLEDLEVRFQPGSEEALASQRSQLVSLLQRASSAQLQGQGEPAAAVQPLPFGVQYLFLFQEPAVRARQLLELAVMLAPRLHMLDVRLKTQSSLEHEPGGQNGAHLGGVRLAGHFPCLTWLRAWLGSRRHGQSDQPCVLEIEAPRLECLMLRRGVLRQLFPALTHLDLYDVRLEEPAASNMLAATGLRALHLVRVDTPAAMPWSNLSQLAELTSLKLCHTVPYEPVVQTLATLRSLRRLELVDIQEEAIADVVAQVSDQLTELVLKVAPTFPVAPRVCDTQRLTNLRSIVLSSDGDNAADFYPSLHTIANVVLI